MRIGVVSDTHGHAINTRSALTLLDSLGVERVLHCGDIGTPDIAKLFVAWPTDFVFGNCDYHQAELAAAILQAGQTCHGQFGELQLAGRRVALLHSHDSRRFRQAIDGGQYDLVCYGHTHVARVEHVGKTMVLNPGALYRANPHSIAVVDLATMQAEIVAL